MFLLTIRTLNTKDKKCTTMKQQKLRTIIHSFISHSLWLHFTSWWCWPTGIGEFTFLGFSRKYCTAHLEDINFFEVDPAPWISSRFYHDTLDIFFNRLPLPPWTLLGIITKEFWFSKANKVYIQRTQETCTYKQSNWFQNFLLSKPMNIKILKNITNIYQYFVSCCQ